MENSNIELMVEFGSAEQMQVIFGNLDSNVRFLENETGTVISQRDGNAYISGPMNGAMTVKNVLEELKKAYSDREYIDEAKISYLLDLARAGEEIAAVENMEDVVAITCRFSGMVSGSAAREW